MKINPASKVIPLKNQKKRKPTKEDFKNLYRPEGDGA